MIPIFLCIWGLFNYDLNERKDSRADILWYFLFVYLTLLIGLRNHIGGDSLVYEEFFNDYYDVTHWRFNLLDFYQPGFTLLVSISKYIYPQFASFQLIHAFIVNTLLFIFISNNSKYRFIVLLIILYMLYLYYMTEILREIIAIMIFSISYPFYKNKKWIKYYIGVALACMFHFSAIILTIIPLLRNIRLNYFYILLIIATVFLAIFTKKLLGFMVEGAIADKAIGNSHSFVGYSMTIACVLKGVVFPLIFSLFVKFGTKFTIKYENMIAILILIGFASVFFPLLYGRTLNYFYLFLCLSFGDYCANAIKSSNHISKINFVFIITLFLLCYLSSYLVLGGWYRYWIPYKSLI
ncbi:MAG: EpsG family protein [Bacteroides sp.]|nr:EpsG family protein [Bacteroides sp.]